MDRRVRFVLSTLAAVLCVSVVATPIAGASEASQADKALDAALERLVKVKGGPPGAVAVVQRGDDRQVHSAGVADVNTKQAITADDHFRIASVSKAFSGATALALVGKGALSLDETIAQRLPDLPAAWGAVTLRQALQHTSGLPDYSKAESAQKAIAASPTVPVPPAQLLSFVADDRLEFKPGSRYKYSNTDNVVVGLMVQAVRQSYEAQLQDQVYGPLGLTQTSLPVGLEVPDPIAHGYDFSSSTTPEDVTQVLAPGWAWASGGIVSTPTDLNLFVRGYVSGKLFAADVRDQQLDLVKGASDPPGPGKNSAGLGVFRYRTKCGTVYGHTGGYPGYTQFIASSANGTRSVAFSVTTQAGPDRGKIFPKIRSAETLAICAALANG